MDNFLYAWIFISVVTFGVGLYKLGYCRGRIDMLDEWLHKTVEGFKKERTCKAEKCWKEIEGVLRKYKGDLIHVRGSEAVMAITAKGVLCDSEYRVTVPSIPFIFSPPLLGSQPTQLHPERGWHDN